MDLQTEKEIPKKKQKTITNPNYLQNITCFQIKLHKFKETFKDGNNLKQNEDHTLKIKTNLHNFKNL